MKSAAWCEDGEARALLMPAGLAPGAPADTSGDAPGVALAAPLLCSSDAVGAATDSASHKYNSE